MAGAGDLRERIAFESQSFVDAEGGGTLGVWTTQFIVAARVQPLRGGEPVIAQRLQGVQPVVIKVRSANSTRQITSAWRAKNARTDTLYQIRAVTPDERRAWIDILAETGVAVNG